MVHKKLWILLLLAFLYSCAYMPVGISPSTSPTDSNEMIVLGHATGESSFFSLFFIIPFGKPDYDAAIQNAIEKYEDGKSLINVRVTSKVIWVLVGHIQRLEVEGDVVK